MNLDVFDLSGNREKERREFAQVTTNLLHDINESLNNIERCELRNRAKEFREEGAIYYVTSKDPREVTLRKSGEKTAFIEPDFPQELRKGLSDGIIAKYQNGTYVIDYELSDLNLECKLDFDNYGKELNK